MSGEKNRPHPAALAHSSTAPAHLARSVRAWNHIACIWIGGNPDCKCFVLCIAPYCLRLFLKLGGFDDNVLLYPQLN
jgi:hypothetical protein